MVPAEDGDKHHDWYSGELPTCVFWTNSPSLLVNRYTLKSTSTSKSLIWSRRYYVHHIFLMWPHRELGYSHSWSPLSWYQWLLDSLQTLGGCLKDFSHIAIDVRSLFPRQASQSRQRAGGEQKTVWKRERLAPLSQNQNFFLLKLSPRYFDGRVVDCSQMGQRGGNWHH